MKKILLLPVFAMLSTFNVFAQWNVVNTGTTQDLYAVDYYSAADIWIGSYNQFVKTTNGGSTWSVTNPLKDASNITIQPANMYDLAVTGTNSAIASGFYLIGNVEYVLSTTNGGANWSYAFSNNTGPLPRYYNGIDVSGTRAIAVGNGGRVVRSTNSGASWAYVFPNPVSTFISDVKFGTFDTVYAAGDNKVLRSVNGGASWTNATIAGSWKMVSCDHNVVYIAASGTSMLKSTDYGITYTTLALPFSSTGVVCAVNKDTVLAAASDGLYVTWTGGQYWEKYDLPGYQPLKMLGFLNSSTGMAVGLAGYAIKTTSLNAAPSFPISSFNVQGGITSVCYGDSVSFINTTAPIAGYTYEWKLNGVTFSTQYNAGVRLFTPVSGAQTVTLVVSNSFGSASSSRTINVTAHDINPLVYSASADSVCANTKMGFSVPNSQPGISYRLRKGFLNIGAAQNGTGGTLYFTYSTAISTTTTFNIKATKTTACFTDSVSVSKTIYIIPASGGPVASCVPTSTVCSSQGITNVTLGSINNTTSILDNNYFDYTCCKQTNLVMGTPHPFSVSVWNGLGEYVAIWIDYNNNGSFSPSERVFFGQAVTTISDTLHIPVTATVFNQKLRMRVASAYNSYDLSDVCFISTVCAQIEDYAVTILPAPIAPTPSFTYTTAVTCATAVTFTNTSYNATSYSWNFGDGSSIVTTQNTTHSYPVTGSYVVSMTATNIYGSTTTTQTINVNNPLVPVTATCHPTFSACSSRPLLTKIEQYGGPSYTLGSSNDYTCTGQFNFMEDSVYTFFLYGNGNPNYFLPFLDANNNGIFENSEALYYHAQNTQNVGVSGYSPIAYFTIPNGGIDSVPLRMRLIMSTSFVTSLNQCNAICGDYKDFTVFLTPHPLTALFAVSNPTVCGYDSVTINFNNSSRGATSYFWDFGDGVTSTLLEPSHTYTSFGDYTVTLITGNGTSYDTLVRTSYIHFNPSLPVPLITRAGTVLSTVAAATSYQWYRNGTLISGATSSSYNATLDGTYKLIITNSNGCTTTSANFSYFPVHVAFAGSPLAVCLTSPLTFTNTTTNATSYLWDFGDGTFSTAAAPAHTYTAAGTYSVKLKACGTLGCDSLIKTNYVLIRPTPDVTPAVTASTICSGSNAVITLSGTVPGATFSWTITPVNVTGAAAGSGTTISQILTATTGSAGTVQYNIKPAASGCNGAIVPVTITVDPSVVSMTNPGAASMCSGDTINIPFSSGSAVSFEWTATDNPNTTGESTTLQTTGSVNNTLVNATSTPQTVVYAVTPVSASGCHGSSQTFNVTVNPLPVAMITSSGATTFCQGDSITLDASAASGNVWSTTDTTQSITVDQSGTYILSQTSVCGTATDSVTVTVNSLPAVPVIIQTGSSLSSSAASGNQWYQGGALLPGETAQTYTLTQEGNYTVTVTNGGCSSSSLSFPVVAVWPGDANNDLVANNYDLLQIGLFSGQTGYARSPASTLWQEMFVADWGPTETNGSDIKHVDCNGNGIINSADVSVITANYSHTHLMVPYVQQARLTDPDLYLVTSGMAYSAGDWVDMDVMAGTASLPVNDLYGIGFDISYDGTLVEPGTDTLIFPVSFLGNPGTDVLTIGNISSGLASGAATRFDNMNVSGYGKIATLHFQVKTDLLLDYVTPFLISNYAANDSAGNPVWFSKMANYYLEFNALHTGITENIISSEISITPNPYNDYTTISYKLDAGSDVSVEVYNAIGQHVETLIKEKQTAGSYSYNFSAKARGFDAGVYFVKLMIDGKVSMRRIVETK